MNAFYDNIVKKIGLDKFNKLQKTEVGIAGAGGLGSNCALNLVRVGFRYLTIVDFDVVDHANLDRQFYFSDQIGMDKVEALQTNLIRINPDLALTIIKRRITAANIRELFGACDVVAECFDSAENKKILVEKLLGLGKFTVTVSGLGGYGASDDIKIRKINDRLVMIGDLESDISTKPAISPRVNIAAAKQADVIMEYVLGITSGKNF